jgi:hypothetical protein
MIVIAVIKSAILFSLRPYCSLMNVLPHDCLLVADDYSLIAMEGPSANGITIRLAHSPAEDRAIEEVRVTLYA